MRATERTGASPGSLSRRPADDGNAGDEVGLRPYRHLAVRVLARAILDLTDPAGSAADRESARVFLAGSGMLLHWCEVAAIDPSWLVQRAGRIHARRSV